MKRSLKIAARNSAGSVRFKLSASLEGEAGRFNRSEIDRVNRQIADALMKALADNGFPLSLIKVEGGGIS